MTLTVHNRIALVFDFDETLAPPTHKDLLKKADIDEDEREDFVSDLVADGWEVIMARSYSLIKASQESEHKITRQMFQEIGEQLELFDGVQEMFERLRACCDDDKIELEFYILTAGFVEIPEATPIADEFKAIWGGAYAFDDNDDLAFVKRVITHEEKREYIQQLAKGTGTEGPNAPADTHQHMDEADMYVPFSQIIYVGDGSSDRPVFSLLKEKGGITIGLLKENNAVWKEERDLKEKQRVDTLVKADYREDSELMQCLRLAVSSICQRIQLQRIGDE